MVEGHTRKKRERWIIEILDVPITKTKSIYKILNNLDIINIMRCEKHVKNCALRNVFKIFNWWSQR